MSWLSLGLRDERVDRVQLFHAQALLREIAGRDLPRPSPAAVVDDLGQGLVKGLEETFGGAVVDAACVEVEPDLENLAGEARAEDEVGPGLAFRVQAVR